MVARAGVPVVLMHTPGGAEDIHGDADYGDVVLDVFDALRARRDAALAAGISRETVTLHVGAGTFLPVKADRIEDHQMHAEWGVITAETAARLNAVRARGNRIVAVGTTSLRLLESAADDARVIHPFEGDTAIFITPGYRFKGIDALVTNFHLPKSTLFMLVSALMGLERMQAAYAHAIANEYRFYSYGDSSLLLPDRQPA
jgi:S-adenosylmethionine:tRNA ribosyltransferase-isomerase